MAENPAPVAVGFLSRIFSPKLKNALNKFWLYGLGPIGLAFGGFSWYASGAPAGELNGFRDLKCAQGVGCTAVATYASSRPFTVSTEKVSIHPAALQEVLTKFTCTLEAPADGKAHFMPCSAAAFATPTATAPVPAPATAASKEQSVEGEGEGDVADASAPVKADPKKTPAAK